MYSDRPPAEKKVSRQKARLARRDAAAAQMRADAEQEVRDANDQEAQNEALALKKLCEDLHVSLYEIAPDGHCMYAAIADQLNTLYPAPEKYDYRMLRMAAARYMRQHAADFMPFISDLDETHAGISAGQATSPEEKFDQYCHAMETTSAWGGQPEILALTRVFHTPIHVVQPGMPIVKVGDDEFRDKRPLLISFHIKLFGLGEHYNSLRPESN
ncbi:ubiquitinyl hydrolase 1 [Malassezia psittaci]|uniref:Ubiquitinyl hydrolase 1 n=1 Tax=Malassezia psittaci TaxID=1821823 RepID=A0AAF0FCT1_9BASI|nr:ubiquitinyl hydrolase 1 [Malassezia psittaci]